MAGEMTGKPHCEGIGAPVRALKRTAGGGEMLLTRKSELQPRPTLERKERGGKRGGKGRNGEEGGQKQGRRKKRGRKGGREEGGRQEEREGRRGGRKEGRKEGKRAGQLAQWLRALAHLPEVLGSALT